MHLVVNFRLQLLVHLMVAFDGAFDDRLYGALHNSTFTIANDGGVDGST